MNATAYKVLKIATEIAVPIAILVAWQLWTAVADDPNFPRLSTILVEFKDLWLFSDFGTHVVPSLKRILLGFGIATVLGVGLGITLGLSHWTRAFAMPHVEYWRAMPPPRCFRSPSSCSTRSEMSRRSRSSRSSASSRSS